MALPTTAAAAGERAVAADAQQAAVTNRVVGTMDGGGGGSEGVWVPSYPPMVYHSPSAMFYAGPVSACGVVYGGGVPGVTMDDGGGTVGAVGGTTGSGGSGSGKESDWMPPCAKLLRYPIATKFGYWPPWSNDFNSSGDWPRVTLRGDDGGATVLPGGVAAADAAAVTTAAATAAATAPAPAAAAAAPAPASAAAASSLAPAAAGATATGVASTPASV